MVDAKLIEAVAIAVAGMDFEPEARERMWRLLPEEDYNAGDDEWPVWRRGKNSYRRDYAAAVAAINASGTHWVAPVELSDAEADHALSATASHLDIKGTQLTVNREKMKRRFGRLRAAYLAKPD